MRFISHRTSPISFGKDDAEKLIVCVRLFARNATHPHEMELRELREFCVPSSAAKPALTTPDYRNGQKTLRDSGMSKAKLSLLSVLIVDDVRAMRAIIRTTLREFGIEKITEAADGEAALAILCSEQVDLVISDYSMEPLNGIEFTRRVRQPNNGVNPYVPILMISGHTEISRVKEALDAGVTAFLAKPITPAHLQKKLVAIMESTPPMVQTETYCGPDRRRSFSKIAKRRRASDFTTTSI